MLLTFLTMPCDLMDLDHTPVGRTFTEWNCNIVLLQVKNDLLPSQSESRKTLKRVLAVVLKKKEPSPTPFYIVGSQEYVYNMPWSVHFEYMLYLVIKVNIHTITFIFPKTPKGA